jgi:hypothetical protein
VLVLELEPDPEPELVMELVFEVFVCSILFRNFWY